MNYIDVHCHLNEEDYGNLPNLIAALQSVGVQKVIASGFDLASSRQAIGFADAFSDVYFTAGIHPTEVAKASKEHLSQIEGLLSHPKCVAVGEIGLDYHYPDTDKSLQAAYFVKQLQLANKCGLPVVIHSRDCAADTLQTLNENKHLLKNGALLHCYSYSVEMAQEFAKLGVYFSFGGTSTYSGSKKAKRVIKSLPQDKLLSETDSPYLPPKSMYGQFPNTPQSIPEIVENMASIRDIPVSIMVDALWQNAHRLFFKL